MDTKSIIIGNLCTLVAMISNSISSTQKTVKSMLVMQNVSQLVYCASAIVLGGYSAAVQNGVSLARNLAAIHNIKSKTLEWILIAAGVVLGVIFNNRGWIGLLPVIGNLQYTLAIFRLQNHERLLKISFLISVASFTVLNIVLYNVVGVIADLTVIVTTVIYLVKGKPESSK